MSCDIVHHILLAQILCVASREYTYYLYIIWNMRASTYFLRASDLCDSTADLINLLECAYKFTAHTLICIKIGFISTRSVGSTYLGAGCLEFCSQYTKFTM